ncbi:FG-GAP-like repeat-containing protein [Pseudotamlana agarivorans]|uniref:FG-GAP-like repeat-containing protein n=1 Tax=Pseudotamlana agarivorans TaxID=481183 RepID=UPI0008379C71|nr:FG-GAP-like repeat-containing protein [Tamlana agarivorans]
MTFKSIKSILVDCFVVLITLFIAESCQDDSKKNQVVIFSNATDITSLNHLEFQTELSGTVVKKVYFYLDNPAHYASLSLYANDHLLIENLNIPKRGKQTVNALVSFPALGQTQLKIEVRDADITLNKVELEDQNTLSIPQFEDISVSAGLDKVNSIKYGGPTVADINQDGYYDFIVNNHNEETSKLYWNNGDGTVTKHHQDLARWFMHDLHGTALGDYDNDGDLDLILTQGGGNGTAPSRANFYKNDNGKFIRYTGDVGISRGARGRGARWGDFDMDGDLDFMLVNEEGLKKEKPQHFFYENLGDGTFKFKSVEGIQDAHPSRALVTDINADGIDDIILYGPMSIWKGNGDFTFTDVTNTMLNDLPQYEQVMAVTDIDIDNDGDLDLYLARGMSVEGGKGEPPFLDSDPVHKEMAIKTRGYKGVDAFEFEGDHTINLTNYYYLAQGNYRGTTYPIFLGENKVRHEIASGDDFSFDKNTAAGWPEDTSEDGLYFGAIGENKWKAALVRNGDLFWAYRFSLSGVTSVTPEFEPQNRNVQDVLLKNENGQFVDVSKAWNLPEGSNSLGVTTGDFNNDGHQDLFVYRWGFIGKRTSDYMLLNTGNHSFETTTMHGANAVGDVGNGDMGQAFDFDLDGHLDILSGSEGGQWYLYKQNTQNQGHYAIVRVGYAPNSHIDAMSAQVTLETEKHIYHKRVGSSGEVFSQSLLNNVHFGLGTEDHIKKVTVKWRNGETVVFNDKKANTILDTDALDPENVSLLATSKQIRKGTTMSLDVELTPKNAEQEVLWASSDENILKVHKNGMLKAVGQVGEKATISATSVANNKQTESTFEIVKYEPISAENIILNPIKDDLYEKDSLQIIAKVAPQLADNQELVWTSTHPKVARVSNTGMLFMENAGTTTIKVALKDNPKLSKQVQLTVKPLVKPNIEIINKKALQKLKTGNQIQVKVNYHAGSKHQVINADEGGVRVWFRHFKNQWMPIKDTVLVDGTALYKTSGTTVKTFSLKDMVPTKNLPEGQFYMIRATFTASDGKMYSDELYPLEIE